MGFKRMDADFIVFVPVYLNQVIKILFIQDEIKEAEAASQDREILHCLLRLSRALQGPM